MTTVVDLRTIENGACTPDLILPLDLDSPSSQDLLAMLVPPVEGVSELLP
jgi:hypothetical protein